VRIISTVPSITELLYDLSLDDEVVGITKFCVHPESWYKSKERIGGTKTLNIDKIISLNPDLIISNKEENIKDQIETLSKNQNVYVTDIKTVEENIELISVVAELTDRLTVGNILIDKYKKSLDSIKIASKDKSAIYLIWKDPLMTIGDDTYIHSVMDLCGISNKMIGEKRYPTIAMKKIISLAPELLLLSSEPYPFKEKHIKDFQSKLPQTNVVLVDGEVFSWYGTRLIKCTEYLKQLVASF